MISKYNALIGEKNDDCSERDCRKGRSEYDDSL